MSINRFLPAFLAAGLLLAGFTAAQDPPRLPSFDRRTPAVLAVRNVGPAVVSIQSVGVVERQHLFDELFLRPRQNRSIGSGVIVHAAGYVVTNEHVVHGARAIRARLRDGRILSARLIRANFESDVAVIRLEGKGPFPTVHLGDSDGLMVGETVIALGNPFGLSNSVTTGVLSAKGREVAFRGKTVFDDFLQTSALINPGNSGGPLLDINGRLIGINVAIDTRGQGIGYAIPSNRVRKVMTALVNPEMVKQEWIGFDVQPLEKALVVSEVDEKGPAAQAGLKRGDVVRSIGKRPVSSRFDLFVKLLDHAPDDEVELGVERAGRSLPLRVRIRSFSAVARDPGMRCVDLTPGLATRFGLPARTRGVIVTDVTRDSPAARIDLQPGDVIVELGGFTVTDTKSLSRILGVHGRKQSSAHIVVFRRGEKYSGTLAF